MNKGTICEECRERGRYSKSNLKIDLREINRELNERNFIGESEMKEILNKKIWIIKMMSEIGCTCVIR